MIVTVTLNPAIDRMLTLQGLLEGCVNRVDSSHEFAGGKGINVSRILRHMGEESLLLGVAAGKNGLRLCDALAAEGLKEALLRTPSGETRVNTKLYDLRRSATTDLNETGPAMGADDWGEFLRRFEGSVHADDIIALCGSLPPGAPDDAYAQLISIASRKGCRTLLDTSGRAFGQALAASPTLVKPNRDELSQWCGRPLPNLSDVLEAAQALLTAGGKTVAVSMGAEGALLVNAKTRLFAPAIPVTARGTVGAGDSMVAALARGMEHGTDERSQLQAAVAWATACVEAGGTGLLQSEAPEKYRSLIRLREL